MPRWKKRPDGSNWGEFGADDQVGRMNLLTCSHRIAAAREVKTGRAFTLSLPLDHPGWVSVGGRKPPQLFATSTPAGDPLYNSPLAHTLPGATDIVCDDGVILALQYSTQWDGLCHVGQCFDADDDGVAEPLYYNGYRAGIDVQLCPEGPRARALGIDNLATSGVQGRGVLVDLHRRYGRERVAVGYDALMRLMDEQDAVVEEGDFLCLYTGQADMIVESYGAADARTVTHACAGLDGHDERLRRWIDESGLVAICADNHAVEIMEPVRCSPEQPGPSLPLHDLCLFKLGIHLGEFWYLSELAEWLRANGRTRFLLTAPPLRLPGAAGSPVTPIATV